MMKASLLIRGAFCHGNQRTQFRSSTIHVLYLQCIILVVCYKYNWRIRYMNNNNKDRNIQYFKRKLCKMMKKGFSKALYSASLLQLETR